MLIFKKNYNFIFFPKIIIKDKKRSHPNDIDNVVAQKLKQAVDRKGKPHSDVVAEFGKS